MVTGMQTSVDFCKNCLNENVALTSFIGDGKDLKDQTNLD